MAALNENALTKLVTVTGIDAKAVAITNLYNVPAGKTFIPIMVVVRCTTFTVGAKAIQAIASFGGNGATYDDFINSVVHTVAAVGVYLVNYAAVTAQIIQAAGDAFKLSIETGSDATTETWAVDVFGYLV